MCGRLAGLGRGAQNATMTSATRAPGDGRTPLLNEPAARWLELMTVLGIWLVGSAVSAAVWRLGTHFLAR